ncbi:MAG TPA: hypothetical protein P5110_06480 [Candidatus Omnitrophota bacterium]|nr:hypothetical protein [Candidatus Omnitrophota bacterium]HRZ15136.1 hypothetical protein [Candidatus Omnitrophota bacterium]
MSKRILVVTLLVLAMAGAACAQDTKPLQLSLFNPIQMVPEDTSIKGVSLDLFYTVNADFTGFALSFLGVNKATGNAAGVQWGLGNWVNDGYVHGLQSGIANLCGDRFVGLQSGWLNITKGDLTGVQLGLVNWTEGYFHGWQHGAFNYTVGRFVGLQSGLLNVSEGATSGANLGVVNYAKGTFKGFQGGFVNYAQEMHGLQLGLVNYTKSLDGLQVGLANYNGNKKPLEFMVIVNWSF